MMTRVRPSLPVSDSQRCQPAYIRFYFAGLDPEKTYTVNGSQEKFSGAELMHVGYFVPRIMDRTKPEKDPSDFSSRLFVVKEV
ncbi:MAG: GH36 C-terminal domain-containing protein [Limosilactobacillus pontis]